MRQILPRAANRRTLHERRIYESGSQKIGEKNGIELAKKVFKLHTQGKTEEEIASECSMDVEKVREILE